MKVYPVLSSDYKVSGIVSSRNNSNAYSSRTFLKSLPCDTVSFTGTKKSEPKQIVMLLGAPNSGKGTFASMISEKYDIPQISTGDILRKEVKNNTELGKKAQSYMNSGALVPDEVIIGMFKNRIAQPDCKKGFILDGFPRTVEQAKKLDELLANEKNVNLKIINLDVSEDILYMRSARRYFCEDCGKTHSIEKYDKSVKCTCGGELAKRKDDTPQILSDRLKVYHNQTEPLLDYYGNSVSTFEMKDTSNSVAKNFEGICTLLED